MNIVMDFRKYDGVIGGVERGVIQITDYVTAHGHRAIIVSKKSRADEVRTLWKDRSSILHRPVPVHSHVISFKNVYLDSVIIQKIAVEERAHVIHFPYNWSFPFIRKTPSILTIHDVIPFTFREAMGYLRNRFVYRPSLRIACRLNTLITTVSEFSKKDIAAKIGVTEEKIKVIYNGLRDPHPYNEKMYGEIERRYGLEKGFVLNVGGIHERKNIVRLVHAFSQFLKKSDFGGKLVVTGSISGAPYQEKMKKVCCQAVNETGLKDRVVFTGFISDEELDHLLARALFLVYPSLYEGFGIPILEAMNAGTPVITSNRTAMKEVAADAAHLVDPCNTDDIASAMSRLFTDKRLCLELRRRGKQKASSYSWEKTAREYLSLYSKLSAN